MKKTRYGNIIEYWEAILPQKREAAFLLSYKQQFDYVREALIMQNDCNCIQYKLMGHSWQVKIACTFRSVVYTVVYNHSNDVLKLQLMQYWANQVELYVIKMLSRHAVE